MATFTPEVIQFVRPSDSSHIMMFNLPLYVTESELYSLCRRYGALFDCRLVQKYRQNAVKTEEKVTSEYLDPLDQQPEIPVKPEELSEQVVSQVYAHVHFYSVNDANSCRRGLDGTYFDATKIRVVHYQRSGSGYESQYYQLPTWKCLDLMNNMVGSSRWSCSIRWIRPYDIEQDAEIVAGQADTFATEEELSAYRWAQQSKNYSCSYACEVEFLIPSLRDSRYDVHVASNGVSHSRNNNERENCKKRAITNAYRFLFAHLALIRLSPTSVHVRPFEVNDGNASPV